MEKYYYIKILNLILFSGKESSGFCDDDVLIGGWSYSRLRGSCNQYLHCAGDRAFIQTCAAGTFYDGQECRHADEVTCPAGIMLHFTRMPRVAIYM